LQLYVGFLFAVFELIVMQEKFYLAFEAIKSAVVAAL
jgi:hypothetical protein